jgi:hypothetical protein
MLNIVKSAALAAVVGGMGLASQAHADAYDRRIDLVNRSSQTITGFYASNVGENVWQEDVLGRSTVRPGQRVRINLNDGTGYCMFDFRTVTASGEEIIRRRVNVCEVSRYTLTDG